MSTQIDIKIRSFPCMLPCLLSPFETLLREMPEMRYLPQEPLRLENRHRVEVLGQEPRTALDQAVHATYKGSKACEELHWCEKGELQ